MIKVYQNKVPQWLKKGDNFENLFSDDSDDFIKIPKINFRKTNKNITNFSDFVNLYNTVNYWGTEIPESLYNYYKKVDKNGNLINKNNILRYLYSFGEKDAFSNIVIEYLTGYKMGVVDKYDGINFFVDYDTYNFGIFELFIEDNFTEYMNKPINNLDNSIYNSDDSIDNSNVSSHFWKMEIFT